MINPDLVTTNSRHDTTETERLNHSTKTPEKNIRRRISIQDPRFNVNPKGRFSPNLTNSNTMKDGGRRSPTPIKIVDLSAKPMPNCMSSSIKQDYLRHFPLLNRKQPLKMEHLTNMITKENQF